VADSVPRPLDSVLRTLVVRPVSIGSVRRFLAAIPCRHSECTGGDALHAIRIMLTRRSSSPFELFDRLEQQLSQQLQTAERVPAAEVHETPETYEVVLELPGVNKAAIEVKASERTLLISAERRSQRPTDGQPAEAEGDQACGTRPAPLLSEFRYGTWSRSFRFPVAIEREQLQAVYRDGLLTVTAPKANTVSTVTVKVEG
jgi:HSP20 family protein